MNTCNSHKTITLQWCTYLKYAVGWWDTTEGAEKRTLLATALIIHNDRITTVNPKHNKMTLELGNPIVSGEVWITKNNFLPTPPETLSRHFIGASFGVSRRNTDHRLATGTSAELSTKLCWQSLLFQCAYDSKHAYVRMMILQKQHIRLLWPQTTNGMFV